MTRRQTLTVKLRRRSKSVAWGISIAGGADLGTPLVVTRSENEDLQKGDVIKKIDEYDVRDLRHVDAQNLLKNSESVKLAIERSDSVYTPLCQQSNNNNCANINIADVSSSQHKFVIRQIIAHVFARLAEQIVVQLFRD